jgi:hypothetical protein
MAGSNYIRYAPGVRYWPYGAGGECIYSGTAQALIEAGVVESHMLPGAPGNPKSFSQGVYNGKRFRINKRYSGGKFTVYKEPLEAMREVVVKQPVVPLMDVARSTVHVNEPTPHEWEMIKDYRAFPTVVQQQLDRVMRSFKEYTEKFRRRATVIDFGAYRSDRNATTGGANRG